jgi:hypothetical protein
VSLRRRFAERASLGSEADGKKEKKKKAKKAYQKIRDEQEKKGLLS